MPHEVLPECVDRLARIETKIETIQQNHLTHLEQEINQLQVDIKKTQGFVLTQMIGVGIAMLALLGKALFF